MKTILGFALITVLVIAGVHVANTDHTPIKEATKPQYSLSAADSPWVVVNKKRSLNPATYTPTKLVVPTIAIRDNITDDEKQVSAKIAAPLERLVAAAAHDGLVLNLQSGYRSYAFQQRLYASYVSTQGQATADMYSAQPGRSEHQTGLAVDLGGSTNPACDVTDCFADTPEAQWLADHAHQYGFIIRYPQGKQSITGYAYEPWHLRYVGVQLATKIHATKNQTLEEYFNVN